MDSSNPVHARVLQDLAFFGVQLRPEMLCEVKEKKNKVKQLFSPKTPAPKLDKIKNQNSDSLIFGVELAEVPMFYSTKFGLVPKFLNDAFQILGKHLEVEGLFRISGSKERIKRLKTATPGDLSNLVQQFFNELPSPLITPKVWNVLLACQQYLKDPSLLKRALTRACLLLPSNNLYTLRFLTDFLAKVASRSPLNRMTSSNLAVVFTPSLLHSTSITIARTPGEGNSESTTYVEVELMQMLLDNWRDIGELPTSKFDEEESYCSFLHGFGSFLSPIQVKNQRNKRKFRGSINEPNVTFNIPDHEASTSFAPKRFKIDNPNDTTTMSRRKRLLNIFSKKKKSVLPLSTTMPDESLQTTIGDTTVDTRNKKRLWKRLMDKIKRSKNKNRDRQNETSIDCGLKENLNPDLSRFAWPNYLDVTQFRGFNASILNRPIESSFRCSSDPFTTPDFKRCPSVQHSPRYVERLRMAERLHLERQKSSELMYIEPQTEQNLDEAVLDDEDYDDYDDLNQAKIDSFDEPHNVTNLSEALLTGTYCGQSSRTEKKLHKRAKIDLGNTSLFEVAKMETTADMEVPKTSLKSLDSGLALPNSDGSLTGSSPEEIPTTANQKPRASGPPDGQKHFKSPLALTFASRRALVFDPIGRFQMDF